MSKFSFPNLIASTTLSGILALPTLAAGQLPEEVALSAATQAIEATMGAGNISAEHLDADPMGIVKNPGTSITSMRTKKGKTESAQAFVSDDGSEVAFTSSRTFVTGKHGYDTVMKCRVPEPRVYTTVIHSMYRAKDDYTSLMREGTWAKGLQFSETLPQHESLVANFQRRVDDYNTANIEVALHKAMKETLPKHALSWTNYDEKQTNLFVRACGADKSCNQLQATIAVDPETRIMSVSVAASSILPAATPNAEREVLTVTANMANVRDNQSIEIRTDTIDRDQLVRVGALGGEAYMALTSFLDAKRGIVTVKDPSASTTGSPYLCHSIIIPSFSDLEKIKAKLQEDNTLKVDVAPTRSEPFDRIIPHRSLKN